MGELDGWHNALQHLKSAYKDESTVSNIATINFNEDAPSEEKIELQDIDEEFSYHSCIPMTSDKYETGAVAFDHDIGFGGMNGIIDVSSIYGDDDSDVNKLNLHQTDALKLDISELNNRPTHDVEFDKAENLIHATEELSVGSGSETDGSSIIFNVWNEDYEGRPDPEVMKKLVEAKKLPRGLDPFVLTQIKRARIIAKLREVDDDDSSQGSCAVMLDHMCMPRFCGEGELTDEESIGNSLVDSLKEGSISASIDLEFFHHKRPKRSTYALVPDNKFNPNKSPEELVLMLPTNDADIENSLKHAPSFLPMQQLTYDDDSECQGTYVETDKEFTLQKYDRAPHRIAELVLAGKKSEAPHYSSTDNTNDTVETTPSRSAVAEKYIPLDQYVLKGKRIAYDEDPIESDRSVIGPGDIIVTKEIVEDQQASIPEEGPLTEFVTLFSDPNYTYEPPAVVEEEEIHPEETTGENEAIAPEEAEESEVSLIPDDPIALEEPEISDEGITERGVPSEPFLAKLTCINEKAEVIAHVEQKESPVQVISDVNESESTPLIIIAEVDVKPVDSSKALLAKLSCTNQGPELEEPSVELPVEEVPMPNVDDREIGPAQTTSSLTDECLLNPVSTSFENMRSSNIEDQNKNAGSNSSPDSDQENFAPSLKIAAEIISSSTDEKHEIRDVENEPVEMDNECAGEGNAQTYVEGRKTISISSAINASLSSSTGPTKKTLILSFPSCCNPTAPLPTTTTTMRNEDSLNDLMRALDLTLEEVNTASYSSSGGEEVVMAMPMEGIIAEQPESKYGRIISPEEFEKLHESFCKSMNQDDSQPMDNSLLDAKIDHDVSNQRSKTLDKESSAASDAAHNIDHGEEGISADLLIETQLTAVSRVSSDDFYDTIQSPSCLSPQSIPQDQKSAVSFEVHNEELVNEVILDIIEDLKEDNSSPKNTLGTGKDGTLLKIDAGISPKRTETDKRRRKKKSKRSGKNTKSPRGKPDEASIVDDLAALRKTMAKNSLRSSGKKRSGAKSLGMGSNSLLDSISNSTKESSSTSV